VVAARDGVSVSELPAPDEFGWTVLVGPEGGLAPDELAILDSAPRLRLGRHVLRTTTAPLAAVAILTSEATRLLPE
jgi:16S rRNA (uracil1498-N3)-methyltransferase